MMKKSNWKSVMVFLLMTTIVMMLIGCNNNSKSNSSYKNEVASSAEESTDSPFVGDPDDEYYMVTFLSGYSYWKGCWKGFSDAAEQFGVKAIYAGTTEYDVNDAITAFEQVIAKKPAGIAVTCMDSDAYEPVINQAVADGINIVAFDSDSPNSDRVTFLGTENYAAGATAAKYIGDELGGKGSVAAVTTIGQSNINERIRGFSETLASDYPGIELVQVVDAGSDEVTCASNVAGLLTTNPDLDYIFAALLLASTGTQQALAEADLTGSIKLVAFDTDNVTLDGIKNGSIEATISQAPYAQGFWSMVYLYYINNGLINPVNDWQKKGYPSLPKTADSGAGVVTIETYENYYTQE